MKFVTSDYAVDPTTHAKLGSPVIASEEVVKLVIQ